MSPRTQQAIERIHRTLRCLRELEEISREVDEVAHANRGETLVRPFYSHQLDEVSKEVIDAYGETLISDPDLPEVPSAFRRQLQRGLDALVATSAGKAVPPLLRHWTQFDLSKVDRFVAEGFQQVDQTCPQAVDFSAKLVRNAGEPKWLKKGTAFWARGADVGGHGPLRYLKQSTQDEIHSLLEALIYLQDPNSFRRLPAVQLDQPWESRGIQLTWPGGQWKVELPAPMLAAIAQRHPSTGLKPPSFVPSALTSVGDSFGEFSI